MSRGSRGDLIAVLGGVAMAAVLAFPAPAQESPQQCAAIVEDAERLACYDALFPPVAGQHDGSAVIIQSERMIPARPTGREPATMTIACEPGKVAVSFAFANQLVSNTGDVAAVTLQVDQNATSVRTLRANAANTALSFGSAQEVSVFLESLEGGTNLKVRMTPVRQRSVTVDFRLIERAGDIAALRETCR